MTNATTHCQFFLLRYVPDAVKNEFVNIGLVLRDGSTFFLLLPAD